MVDEAKTFQQLVWIAQRKRVGDMPTDLEKELITIEAEEDWGDVNSPFGTNDYPEIRRSPQLLKKVMVLSTRRNEMNAEYREKLSVAFASESNETFDVYSVNLEKKPGGEVSEHPIIIAPGFTVGHEAVRRNAIGLAELGYSSLTFEVPPETKAYDASIPFPDSTPEFTKHHASALIHTINAANEKIFETPRTYNVIGYSYGAIVAIHAAIAEPEKFHSIVLINPGGLSHLDDGYLLRFAKLVWNSPKHGKQVLEEAGQRKLSYRERFGQLAKFGEIGDIGYADKSVKLHNEFSAEMNDIGARGGLPVALKTASAISQADLVPLIRQLESKGVKIGIWAAEDDPLFPVDDIEVSGAKAGVPTYTMKGAHANLGFNPGPTSELCIDLFRDLDPEGEQPVRHKA